MAVAFTALACRPVSPLAPESPQTAAAPLRQDSRTADTPTSWPAGVNDVKAFVYGWFALFDRNAPVDEFLPALASDGLVMQFPEATLRSRDDFKRWYAGILRDIASASHDVQKLDVSSGGGDAWNIDMVVV